MIIAITAAGTLELKEPDDFKSFKIVAEKPGATDAEIAEALKGVGTLDAEHKHAWITQTGMKNWGGHPAPAEWIASFDDMLEKVKKYGFVDEVTGSVRAHIERA
jgi:hypothetical protein